MTFIAYIHHLLLNHCTRCEHYEARSSCLRQRYLRQVSSILNKSTLGKRSPEEIWNLGWDKPFYANITASRVGPCVEKAREAHVFANREAVASPDFMVGRKLGTLVTQAINCGALTGACAVPYRLERVQAYARAVPRIAQELNCFHDLWLTDALSADELQERAVAIAEDISMGGGPIGKVQGFGFTTACHLLADLGLPVFKPDIWVCRIISSLPGVHAEIRRAWRLAEDVPLPFDFLEKKLVGNRSSDAYRRIVQPVMNALVEDALESSVAANEFNLKPAFLRARFVDFTLVHFAISAETEVFGLERRPVDVLLAAKDEQVPAHLKALARWLEAGQNAHSATNALKKAKAKVRLARSAEQQTRAKQRLADMSTPAAQTQRTELTAKAQKAWEAHEEAVAAKGWKIDARYPEGCARRETSGAWAYKRAALARRAQTQA